MTQAIDRRETFALAAAAAGFAALSGASGGAAGAEAKQGTPMTYATKPMPFNPEGVNGLSAKLLTSHYDNNYAGAVKRLNAITAALHGIDWATAQNFTVNGLKREELFAMNSMILHELYFASLGGTSGPDRALTQALEKDFANLDAWRNEFAAMGKALGGGSGWVLLCYVPRDKRLVNGWAADHTMTPAGATPILALDMYEHAYHMDYGAKAGAYVDAFMKAINWSNAAALYQSAAK